MSAEGFLAKMKKMARAVAAVVQPECPHCTAGWVLYDDVQVACRVCCRYTEPEVADDGQGGADEPEVRGVQ